MCTPLARLLIPRNFLQSAVLGTVRSGDLAAVFVSSLRSRDFRRFCRSGFARSRCRRLPCQLLLFSLGACHVSDEVADTFELVDFIIRQLYADSFFDKNY